MATPGHWLNKANIHFDEPYYSVNRPKTTVPRIPYSFSSTFCGTSSSFSSSMYW